MNKTIVLYFLIFMIQILGCGSFTGINESIESYSFEFSTEELIIAIDKFLVETPEYYDGVDEDSGYGTIYTKIPELNQRFGFRVGGLSEIRLMNAGKINGKMKFGEDLNSFQKEKISKVFESYFINKIKDIDVKSIESKQILVKPFILTSNNIPDFNSWYNHYVLRKDTFLMYALPIEFDSIEMDFLEDLILCYGINSKQKLSSNQYKSEFRINKDYSGYIDDSIFIDSYYKVIGQKEMLKPIFETKEWEEYISDSNSIARLNCYDRIRDEREEKGYMRTQVYSKHSQEYWMLKDTIE